MFTRVVQFSDAGIVLRSGGIDMLDDVDSGSGWCWLELNNCDVAEERRLLTKYFNIDPLAIADAQRQRHPPKMELYDDYLFLLLRGLKADAADLNYGTMQIGIFIGRNWIITRHEVESVSIDAVWGSLQSGAVVCDCGPAELAYLISRKLVDRYTPILMDVEARIDQIENEIFSHSDDALLEELLAYSIRLKKLGRNLNYQSRVFQSLVTQAPPMISDLLRHEFQDVYEQFERLGSLAELYKDLTADLMNSYMSVSGHQLNKVMKVLTLVTIIFLPLTLVAGIYGMNFSYIPELNYHNGYFVVLGVMTLLAVSLVYSFKRLRLF